ncbi:asparagine synthase-related protein [Streptomyces sp. NPDC003077]|uniref:asparagine synthase-related protein n=1 Tax=Streptomyces sp. NPDC003077 TaxID=3154443 RepID=UPI0033B22FFC
MPGGAWFVVLPDGEGALPASRALRPLATRVIPHASGRPWLMGRWPAEALTLAAAGDARAAVVGTCPATAAVLRDRLGRARTADEAGAVADGLPGCFHLAASVAGRVRVQGTLAAVRRVFHTRVQGTAVAADRPEVLARLTRAAWDEEWLALRLTGATMPFPLHESVPWRGVRAVPADHWLDLRPDGHATERRRWRAPEPRLTLAEGAPAVREALADAVAARVADGGTVSADLSGGMDSSSLAFLAAHGPADLVTYRWAERDAGNDDARYAGLAAARLPRARHLVDPVESGPAMFAGLDPRTAANGAEAGEPFGWIRSRARVAHVARTAAEAGSRLHLAGHGGDELFRPGGHTHLHDLVRSRPLAGWRQVRAYRIMARGSWPATLRALADRDDPARQVTRRARELTSPHPDPRPGVEAAWVPPLRMPPWATADAVTAARAVLERAAAGPVPPLAPRREQHEVLLLARCTGVIAGQAERISAAAGARLTLPFLDDEVLHAALAVRPEDRNRPDRYKPLLARAMHGLLPAPLLDRTTKGEFSADFHQGLRRHRADLLDLAGESYLARHGLIDVAALRAALLRPHPTARTLAPLDATLACEVWLRAAAAPPWDAPEPSAAPCGAARDRSRP